MTSRNDDQSMEPPDDTGNPPTPANEAASGNGDRPTRSITVSIQYSYFNPNGLANLNQANAGSDNEETPPVARPDGALILSFRDVPTSTPQERLESIISIAAELAMRRFSDLMSQPKGINKEQFEQLPTVRISELPDEQSKLCSICYDSYEDEPESVLKRSREDDSGDQGESRKKQRSESPAIVASTQEDGNSARQQSSQEPNDEEAPTYKHSPVKLPCGHIFGRECLFKWSQLENSCPLCRQKISEAASSTSDSANENMANLNADAFERIRQALYSTPQSESAEVGRSDAANEGHETNESNDLQNFTFSRSGIVLLRPDGPINPTSHQPPSNQGQAIAPEVATSAANAPFNGLPGFNPFAVSNAENRRIQWIPLPMSTIQTGTDINNIGNNNGTESEAGGSSNAHDRHQDRSPNERLRAILNNIFNVSHSANMAHAPENSDVSNGTSSAAAGQSSSAQRIPSTDEHRENSNSSIPRRRSFLDHILRITNRHRSRSDNATSRTTTPASLHSANSMFNSGVASYRNRAGQVSTFNVTDGQLPSPLQPNQSSAAQDAASSDGTGSQPERPRPNDGESSRESNDTSS